MSWLHITPQLARLSNSAQAPVAFRFLPSLVFSLCWSSVFRYLARASCSVSLSLIWRALSSSLAYTQAFAWMLPFSLCALQPKGRARPALPFPWTYLRLQEPQFVATCCNSEPLACQVEWLGHGSVLTTGCSPRALSFLPCHPSSHLSKKKTSSSMIQWAWQKQSHIRESFWCCCWTTRLIIPCFNQAN